jgi:glyoxylase-like metal-dependent hydrolase (beta-lactamase superfamily II)
MTFEEMTSLLGRLRIHPLTLEIPFSSAGRHVHFYFVEDSRPALFDTGLANLVSEKYIEKALGKLGYALGDVKRVFLTHGHIDHYGNAKLFQDRGAEVFMHPADVRKVTPPVPAENEVLRRLYINEFLSHGFPEDLVEHLEAIFFSGAAFAQKVEAPTTVRAGDVFAFDHFDVRVAAFPGHTPGCIGYLFGDTGVAVTGDHLLKGISPNPLFELSLAGEKFPSLTSYFSSLGHAVDLNLRLVLPAHGPFITDVPELVESLRAFYTRRQAKLFNMLAEPAGAFHLCQTYYRRLKGLETFLGFSEILGNLEMMADRGEITLERSGAEARYRRVTAAPLPINIAMEAAA